jgi:hypothetical protein
LKYKLRKMTSADNIRNNIIDKLLTISNKEYLNALYNLVNSNKLDAEIIQLSAAQIQLLNLSDEDIKNNRVVSQEDLDQQDLEWLKNNSIRTQ